MLLNYFRKTENLKATIILISHLIIKIKKFIMFKKISLIAFVTLLLASCDIGREEYSSCPVVIGVRATSVTGPSETAVDIPIILEVSYKTKKNCGDFVSFYSSASSGPLSDIITVNVNYDACSCDEVESTEKENYTFKKSTPGVYSVKFRQTNETFIVHTVTVQ